MATTATTSDEPNQSRKMAQYTRALMACETCRRQKTRCMREPDSKRCLRCSVLKKTCSHESAEFEVPSHTRTVGNDTATTTKLNNLQESVDKILSILDTAPIKSTPMMPAPTELVSPSPSFLLSPFSIASTAHDLGPINSSIRGDHVERVFDDLPEIDNEQALRLIEVLCNSQYLRWISIEPTSSVEALSKLRSGSTILLYTSLVIVMRYMINDDTIEVYKKVATRFVGELANVLSQSSWQASTMGTLQALVLVSIYGVSISTTLVRLGIEDAVIDPWYTSGIGIAGIISASSMALHSFGAKSRSSSPFSRVFDVENEGITHHRVFNHLCLVHLGNCILSGRPGMVDFDRVLGQCRGTLNLPGVNNFDGRMISEIEILSITYRYLQSHDVPYPEAEMDNWESQWAHLFSLQQLEFVQPTYHFCQIIAKIKATDIDISSELFTVDNLGYILANLGGEACNKIVNHAQRALEMVNTVTDDYFAHLSDQMQFFYFFCGWIILRMRSISEEVTKLMDLLTRVAVPGDILSRYRYVLTGEKFPALSPHQDNARQYA